ncbi:DUF4355 domain-containing protein [Enterococcus pallens]|uniref:DUF4355 domain-containing protein n=1 Tax=Enterococcus pallens ATCC BAA-351 TaxID=1158607 RepID=R2SPW1_9ENTE|nr:DUF4355 domain-containing protein [Enterococcus pallens]EOH94836.1 hypothetical protein UAU_01758 [Enterococcus pallens ATCC BAA-351]EOU14845.1 hypothetical protein I588_04495 [Enterococcus pallens ATCC BAA-351]OJG76221.1 hypothetical protein RV10_GL004128 [Enterococcus pallens]
MKEFIAKKCEQKLLELNLQMFAGEGGGDGGSGEPGGAGNLGGTPPVCAEPISFASQSELDSFVDKRLAKSLETAQAKWKAEQEEALEAAKSEAARLAQMTAEERAQMEEKKRQEAEAERLADITRRELRLEAFEELTERNLPKELIDAVVLTDADACKKSVDSIEKAFRAAVEEGVKDRLANSAQPPVFGGGSGGAPEAGSIGSRLGKQSQQKQESKFFKN